MIRTIWLCDLSRNPSPEEAIPLRFPSYTTTNDLQLLIQETFSHQQTSTTPSIDTPIPIGLHDQQGRYYPISMIQVLPDLFTKGVYSIVYLNDKSTVNILSSSPELPFPPENNTIEPSPGNLTPANLSLQVPLRFLDGYFYLICQEIKYRTGLDNQKIGTYFQALSQFSVTNDLITKGRFLSSMVYALHQSNQQSSQSQFDTPPIPPDVNAIFEEIFDMFVTEDSPGRHSSSSVEILRICRFLSLFSGGLPNENIKILYYLFDYDQDGAVSFNDLYNCFRDILMILSRLYDSVLDIMFTYSLDTIAILLAQYVITTGQNLKWQNDFIADSHEEDENEDANGGNDGRQFNYSGDEKLSLQQFYEWFSKTEHILYLPPRSIQLSPVYPLISSYQHISAVKKALSFHPITCETLKLSIQHFSENQPSFISSIGVFSSLILSFRMHNTDIFSLHHPTAVSNGDTPPLFENSHYLMTMETILRYIFDSFDPLHSEYVAVEDIFASLSLFLHASWHDRLTTYCQLRTSHRPRYQLQLNKWDTHLDPLLTEVGMIDYLVAVLKTISLFQGHGATSRDEDLIQNSTQLIQHALNTGLIPSQPHGCILLNDYALWLESNIDLGEPELVPVPGVVKDSEFPAPVEYPLPSREIADSILQDIQMARETLGFLGFTAEDFMDLLGESANAGFITLSSWLHIVLLMNQLNSSPDGSSPSQQLSNSLTTVATNIFHALTSLSSTSSLSPPSHRIYQEQNKDSVAYHLLLTSLIMLCDSPVEDKIAVIFTVLSETIPDDKDARSAARRPTRANTEEDEEENHKKVTISNILFFIECVMTILSLLSSPIKDILAKTQQSTDVIATATFHYAMKRSEFEYDAAASAGLVAFNMDEFCNLFWAILDQHN